MAVVSKGDPRLIDLEERTGLHFPADADGRYAGYYPRTSEEAIAQLEAACGVGAEFLCLPTTAFWWLEHYAGLAAWLDVNCHKVADDRETCIVYDLLRSPGKSGTAENGAEFSNPLRALLEALLPEDALLITIGIDDSELAGSAWTIAALGRSIPSGFEQRLQMSSDSAFVLVSRRESDPPPGPDLARLLTGTAKPIAQRPGLCDLYEVKGTGNPARLRRSSESGDQPPKFPPSLDSEVVDKLSRRLEQLGIARQDGPSPPSTDEVPE